jgi:hypothetical protein
MRQIDHPLGRILRDDPRRRVVFEHGLRSVFPVCRDPLPPRMKDALQELHGKDFAVARSNPPRQKFDDSF